MPPAPLEKEARPGGDGRIIAGLQAKSLAAAFEYVQRCRIFAWRSAWNMSSELSTDTAGSSAAHIRKHPLCILSVAQRAPADLECHQQQRLLGA